MKSVALSTILALIATCSPVAFGLSPRISEFMASNVSTITFPDQTTPDWIELHNPGDTAIDLAGWHLTDDPLDANLWTFPDGVSLDPGEYLVLFATGNDIRDPDGFLQTNFQLASGGEYLALIRPDGEIHQEFAPEFPNQREDMSYGVNDEGIPAFFVEPTPGQPNGDPTFDQVADTKFSVNRGFYDAPFELVVTSATPGATIYYTTDGSDPTLESTSAAASDDQTPPSLTLTISDTTILRAFASKPNFFPTNIDTQSYFFLDQVISHPSMSPTITGHPEWGPQMREALLELPSISLITQEAIPDREPTIQSPREIPVSIEMLFPDGREGFQENAGVERFGGQYTIYEKQALRISFKDIYGPKRLRFNLFDDVKYGADDVVDNFDQILLRNGSHDAIFYEGYPRPRNGAFVRNRYFLDRQLEMGNHSLRGKFVHVYLNGVYNGHYHLMERPTADHMAQYFGGDEDDYDVMRGRSGISVQSGERRAWDSLLAGARNWDIVQQYMDVDSYIDYMLLNFYGGNDHDWYPQHNWVAARKRDETGRFKFFMWDSDFLNRARLPDGGNTVDNGGPGGMLNNLRTLPEFRRRMADRAQKHFYGNGVLSAEKVNEDFNAFGEELAVSIVPETARWGNRNGSFYTPDTFQNAISWLANDYPQGNQRPRVETVIQQMRAANLFPDVDAPSLSHYGGSVPSGYPLAINHLEGNLYYTTDGTDPQLPDGSVNPDAVDVGGSRTSRVIIPRGSNWRLDDSGTDRGEDWRASDFDDSAWIDAPSPIGFGGITNTTLATFAFAGKSRQVTFYCRKTFDINGIENLAAASMNIQADDGVLVFLNGQEILRDNLPDGPINIDTGTTANGNEGEFDQFPVDPSFFVEGTNTLCVEVHNRSLGSNDMVFDLELVEELANPDRIVPIDSTAVVKSRVLKDGEWSAMTEATFITDVAADATNLVISEIHYHPATDQGDDAEFVELMNVSNQSISLAGVSFTNGIRFAFTDQDRLEPGERIVLVYNPEVFKAAYGDSIPIGGIYTSRLSNGGERLTLSAADGSVIETLRYDDGDPWPGSADGMGYSLVRIAPGGGGRADQSQNWRSSIDSGGTPGASDSTSFSASSGQTLLEYATGNHPGQIVDFIGETAIFEHLRIHGADDAHVEVQVSSDLENWTTLGVNFLNQSNRGDQTTLMRWALPIPDGNRVFARVSVTLIR